MQFMSVNKDTSQNKNTTRVTITLPSDLYQLCKNLAHENDRTISAQIANMLKEHLKKSN